MSQINERLDTFSQKEKDEIKEKDRKQRMQGLIAKYGRKKVEAAKRNAREDGSILGEKMDIVLLLDC